MLVIGCWNCLSLSITSMFRSIWWLLMILRCLFFCWKNSEYAERGGSAPKPEGSAVCRVKTFSFFCLNCHTPHRLLCDIDLLHPMVAWIQCIFQFALNICKVVLRRHLFKFKLILHILRGALVFMLSKAQSLNEM